MLRSIFLPRPLCCLVLAAMSFTAFAADTPKPTASPDVVTFVDGEKMCGQLLKVADGKVFFHSEMVGDVSFEWAKIKELKTAKSFAVIAKGAKLSKRESKAPEGTLDVNDKLVRSNPHP